MNLRSGKQVGSSTPPTHSSLQEELKIGEEIAHPEGTSSPKFEQPSCDHPIGEIVPNLDLNMALNTQSLKELAAPTLNDQPLCIVFPTVANTFKLHSGFIQLLPSFHGLPGEDPHRHLKEFHVVCSNMKPDGVQDHVIKLRAFPFSLHGSSKDWLYDLPTGSIIDWDTMQRKFLEKYFPASRAASIRKEICGIRQLHGESLYEYWERFKRLCASCPHHQISEQLLIQYFYEGLHSHDRSMIDAASGGALVDKTPQAAKDLISNMAANTQSFGTRQDPLKKVGEVSSSSLEDKVDKLTTLVGKILNNNSQARAGNVGNSFDHSGETCSNLGVEEQANVVGYQNQPPRRYNPYSNTYNEGWRDHPNFRWGNQGGRAPNFSNNPPNQPQAPPPPNQSQGMSLEDMVKSLASSSLTFQKETKSSIQNLETQVGQLASDVGLIKAQLSNKLPSQPLNPRDNSNA